MRKALKIIALCAGIISVVSSFVLGCLYMEDAVKYLQKIKRLLVGKAKISIEETAK